MSNERYFIYGASLCGERAFEKLNGVIDIEGFIDSDPKKQGMEFCGKKVFNRSVLRQNDIAFIASWFHSEIVDALNEQNFYNTIPARHTEFIDVYLYKKFGEKICQGEETKKQIKENNAELKKTKKRSILLLADSYSHILQDFIKIVERSSENLRIDVISFDKEKRYTSNGRVFEVKDFSEFIYLISKTEKYDVINVHYITDVFSMVAEQLRNACKKLVCSIWGSDFYRADKFSLSLKKKLFDLCDVITITNIVTLWEFNKYYNGEYEHKCKIIAFGLSQLEFIDKVTPNNVIDIKEKLNIPKDKTVVLCGNTIIKENRALELLDEFERLDDADRFCFVFPMTYGLGHDEYRQEVKNKADGLNFDTVFVNDFLDNTELAALRKATDIFVTVQTTDQLSLTLRESLYAGASAIVGSWLPYGVLKDLGAYFLEVDDVTGVNQKLNYFYENKERIKQKSSKNKDAIDKLSRWEYLISDWLGLYNG